MKKYWWFFLGITVTWFLYAFVILVLKCITDTSIAQAGQMGDTFGALNALFSGLAFAGLIISIRQQQEEIVKSTTAQQNTELAMKAQTKLMSLTAMLNGYTTYLDYLNVNIQQENQKSYSTHLDDLNKSRGFYLAKIELILSEIDAIRLSNA